MEFLVEFEMKVPDGIAQSEMAEREQAEASAAAKLAADGHLLRVWRRPTANGAGTVVGLYRAESEAGLDDLLRGLPIYPWTNLAITPLKPHPNDPAATGPSSYYRGSGRLPPPARSTADIRLPVGGRPGGAARPGRSP